jgi:lipid-A-disaccharide synthase
MTLIYVIAGEASGDAIGGRLIAALRAQRADLRFAGIGGPLMQAQGVTSLFPMQDLALMGLLEVIPKLRMVSERLRETVGDIGNKAPAVVVTIDSPGFCLRVLRRIAPFGIRRVHYVAPQVWGWKENRVRHYPGLWHDLLCLLPFEPEWFARHNLPATFVGHPVLESGVDQGNAARFRATHNIAADSPILLLLPGSRRGEISRLLPIYAETLNRLIGIIPVVIAAPGVANTVTEAVANWRVRPLIVTEPRDKHDAFAAATAALSKSGTSTTELAIAGVPMVMTYRVNPMTAMMAKRLVKVRYATLVNLLAQREIIPEMIQEKCCPDLLIDKLLPLLTDPKAAQQQRDAFGPILRTLAPSHGTPSEAAAGAVLRQLV